MSRARTIPISKTLPSFPSSSYFIPIPFPPAPSPRPPRPAPLHLSDLPDITLRRIMDYVDDSSLVKLSRAGRWLNNFILHAELLTNTRVTILRTAYPNEKTRYRIEIVHRKTIYIHEYKKDSSPSTSVFVWLARKFKGSPIRKLALSKFHFDEEQLSRADRVVLKSGIRLESLELYDTTSGDDPKNPLRVLTALRPRKVCIVEWRTLNLCPWIFTDSLFNYMSTLESFEMKIPTCMAFIKCPTHVNTIPREFITSTVLVLPLKTVVKTIRAWYDGNAELYLWRFSLRDRVCPDVEHLVKAVGLPYETSQYHCRHSGATWDGVILKSRKGKRIYLRELFEPDHPKWGTKRWHTIKWSIKDSTYVMKKAVLWM